jgi:hypothetical protein
VRSWLGLSGKVGRRRSAEGVSSVKRAAVGSAPAVTSLQGYEPSSLIGGMRAPELAKNYLLVRKAWIEIGQALLLQTTLVAFQ